MHGRRAPPPLKTYNEQTAYPRASHDHIPLPTPPIIHIHNSRSTPLPRRKPKRPTVKIADDNDPVASPLSISPPVRPIFLSPHTSVSPAPIASPTRPRPNVLRDPRLHQTFRYVGAPTGRLKSHTVGFAEYGALDAGHPAIVIGGHGCSRLVGVMFEGLAIRHGIRMIWPERPGYGLSEECSAQELSALEWADVVIQLADHLGIRQFSIIAQSVGTVFALAIAHKYPTRIHSPIFLISPWVSTQAANTFKWTRRLPAPIVTRTISLAMDVMWIFSKSRPSTSNDDDSEPSPRPSQSSQTCTLTEREEDDLLASLEDDIDLPTDFPTHRPLRHVVRPKLVSLYLAMDKMRMAEPYSQGQLGDVMVALEKYHPFGFHYSDITLPVSAVWGDKDGLIPQRAIDILANSLRDVRLKILDGEGHDLVWKEGVMEWTMRGIAERWRSRPVR